MQHQTYHLSQSFIEELFERISGAKTVIALTPALQDIFHREEYPESEQLAEIISVAYWASYATEEGQPVSVSIVYRQLDRTADTFQFDSPLDLSTATISKLSPALKIQHADLGVWPDPSGKLKIWGFTAPANETAIKTNLCVRSLGPGRLLVMHSGRTVAAMDAHRAVFIDPRPLLQSIMPKIVDQAKATDITLQNLSRYNAILQIAQQMRLHRRGGTVLIVPEDGTWKKSITMPVKYAGGTNFLDAKSMVPTPSRTELEDAEQLQRIVKEMNLNLEKDSLRNWQQTQQQCARIAQLTAVDGALVMTYDRFVYCFGAKIGSTDLGALAADLEIIEPFEGYEPFSQPFSSFSGTRHASAAQFAFDQPGALAVVASQDGNVTFFTRNGQTGSIITVRQAEMALLHEGLGSLVWNLSFFAEMGWLDKGISASERGYLTGIINRVRNLFRKEG
jgi:hypothetical protein